jgi:hypothetical protein
MRGGLHACKEYDEGRRRFSWGAAVLPENVVPPTARKQSPVPSRITYPYMRGINQIISTE